MGSDLDLTVIVPAVGHSDGLPLLLPEIRQELNTLAINSEILVLIDHPDHRAQALALEHDARLLEQAGAAYGEALQAAFAAARGAYLLTIDADLFRRPTFISSLWRHRLEAEISIASRYVRGGRALMPRGRRFFSRILNALFSRGLSLRIRDMSSANRLYRADLVQGQNYKARDLDILQEVLVRAYMDGWKVQEIPFEYEPRIHEGTTARLLDFGIAYLKTLGSLWKDRNSILSADYDDRAHDSPIPLQRYWQRQRFRHITDLIEGEGPVLDVGCGSSRIIGALPEGSVGVDILLRKLRYGRKFEIPLVQASGFELPFPDESFSCVLCSQVIEHVPKESPILDELDRTLASGGRLVLGTPDYANWEWVVTEKLYGWFAPGAYADEHIGHYTREELIGIFTARGYTHEATRYILKGELILAFRKGSRPAEPKMRPHRAPTQVETSAATVPTP
jgi:SAM-dependent methyltransferase